MTLTELAVKWSVDKLHSHSYIPVYESLFKDREVHRLLEIGIGYEDLMTPFVPKYIHGASLKMWEEYFTEAAIFACDIREDTLVNEGRIHSWRCDQSSYDDLISLMTEIGKVPTGPYKLMDVIIDDGSHDPEHQFFTCQALLDFLRPGGVYVIEDIRDPDGLFFKLIPIVRKLPWDGFESLQVFRFNKRHDDCMIVIQK